MATLSAIVHVDQNNFWMTLDAAYDWPSIVWKDLADVKPSCAVCTLDLPPVKAYYNQVVANLHELQAQVLTPGYQKEKSFLPEAYQHSLEDAIVRTHWAIAGKKESPLTDVFVGEVDIHPASRGKVYCSCI